MIGADGAKLLSDAICLNKKIKLTEFIASGNKLGDEGLASITKIFEV